MSVDDHRQLPSIRMLAAHGAAWARSVLRGGDDHALAQRTAIGAFVVRALGAVVAYLSQVVMARWMGGFEYGIFVFVWVWVTILGMLSALGLNMSVVRFVPQFSQLGDLARLRGILLSSRLIGFSVSTVMALCAAGVILALGDAIEGYYVLPFVLTLIAMPLFTVTDIQDGIARSYSWPVLALAPNYLVRPLLILAILAGAIIVGEQPTARLAALASVAATWIAAIGQLVVLRRRLAGIIPSGPSSVEPVAWVRASLPLLLVDGFYMLLANTDVLVLGRYHDPAEVAVYFAALKTLALVQFVSFAVSTASGHRFSQYHAAGDRARLEAFVRDAVKWTFWPSLAAALFVLAVGEPLLMLFGPDFTHGYYLMFILAIGLIIRAAFGPLERLLNMLGHERACAGVLMVTVAVNLALNFALIPRIGLAGAACATSAAVALESILLFNLARRRIGLSVSIWHAKPD